MHAKVQRAMDHERHVFIVRKSMTERTSQVRLEFLFNPAAIRWQLWNMHGE
jgi:hypothetical protein